ncbi:MAG TPA: PaaI family thioesterase [Albitalea sp.]
MSRPVSAPAPAGFAPMPAGGEFIAANGPIYLLHEGETVQLGFRVEARHTNPLGICHGGMMASFCDMLLPMTAHRRVSELSRRFLPTISLQIDYLAPSPLGAWVQGEAQVLRTTRTMVFAQGLVTADGVPVARASGIMKIGPPFSGDEEAAG